MSKEEVQCMIDEVDENKDGKLDYKEVSFLSFVPQNLLSTLQKNQNLNYVIWANSKIIIQ